MAAESPPAPVQITPATWTTRRGLATASFCLGFWGTLTFWWYPFGLMIASVGLFLGVVTTLMGVRAGKDGEHLALLGIGFSFAGINLAIVAYRFMQLAFEEGIPFNWPPKLVDLAAWLGV